MEPLLPQKFNAFFKLKIFLCFFFVFFNNNKESCFADILKEEITKNTKKSIFSELSLYVEHLLEVEINKEEIGKISLFLEDKSNNFYAKKTDLEEWNFTCPKEAPVMHKGEPYYSLQAFKDLEYQFNPTRMSIHITVSPKDLQPQDIDFGEPSFVVPSDSPLGAYVNYNTDAQMEKSARQFGGILGCGIFGKYGLLFNQALLQTTSNSLSNSSKFVRLNSSWRIDYPFEMQSLILGDSYTPTSLWGGCVGIGGIQWRKNFHTQPMFITFPTPSLEGEATIPSTIDLYVDNMKVGEKKKVSGPFSINSFPVITGEGNLRLVKTDLLGNQEEILVPYYASKKLLKPGLQNFSYSAGMIRHSFGIKQADYKNLVFAGNL
jgi:outer membrane usher protein